MNMRRLLSDYVIYIREYIISSIDKIDNLQLITKRLEGNCSDMGTIISPIYGEYNGNRFTELLQDYLELEIDFIDSTVKGEIEKSISDKSYWYMNSVFIMDFLSAIDGFDRSYLRELFFDYLCLTENYVISRIHKSYSDDIKIFDDLYDQTMLMADFLSEIMSYRIKD